MIHKATFNVFAFVPDHFLFLPDIAILLYVFVY